MKNFNNIIVLLLVAMLLMGSNAVTSAFAANTTAPAEDGKGKKILKAVAVAAVIGVAAYAISKSDDRRYSSRRSGNDRRSGYDRRNSYNRQRGNRRSYTAVNYGFQRHNSRNSRNNRYSRRGSDRFRVSVGRLNFEWRPYDNDRRYDRAFNEGWERGYYAGFLQGQEDRQRRQRFDDRFSWDQRTMWGYARDMGSHRTYEKAFQRAFKSGYRGGFERREYGDNNFGRSSGRRY
jgi:hypothetical protein